MQRLFFLLAMIFSGTTFLFAQPDRWQQRVKYVMDINMNVHTNRFTGKQKLEYWNNSPDTLDKVFYHLYWNAFQPNSMMDTRSRELGKILFRTRDGKSVGDWDARVQDRILHLNDDEIGYQKIISLKMNGAAQQFTVYETILEVKLTKPILPKSKVVLIWSLKPRYPCKYAGRGVIILRQGYVTQ